ncbi:Rrf2 family transcriptional regulator [Noviherbaspirillum saxi]|uniref:Uncharacterized protein n=1 Tax=Noviherbaspirillum saxi TaxID=2320863 RepID=A0A3A3FTL4_9BURK|nr:Rrf2 family transcriptional regulator [Noviherbaspirillum saxi]RJF97838.1 hypothetical protein D3871_04345 [Noviherbaspirillum saxi]
MQLLTTAVSELASLRASTDCLGAEFQLAVRIVADLSLNSAKKGANAQCVATSLGIEPDIVTSILYRLCDGGIVSCELDTTGLWRRARPLESITFAQIFECFFVDDVVLSTTSHTHRSGHNARKTCEQRTQTSTDILLAQANLQVRQTVLRQLEKFNLGALVGSFEKTRDLGYRQLSEFV